MERLSGTASGNGKAGANGTGGERGPVKAGEFSLAAGFCALIIAMGVGRFVHTSLLPEMMRVYGFDEAVAGAMAGWNYAGYLVGALAARGARPGRRRHTMLVLWLALSVATTAGMGLVRGEASWHAVRFLSGLASGGIFVLASAIVLDALAAVRRPEMAGFLYSGVGTGIALSGLGAPVFSSFFGIGGAWVGMGLVCIPLAVFAAFFLHPAKAPSLAEAARNTVRAPAPAEAARNAAQVVSPAEADFRKPPDAAGSAEAPRAAESAGVPEGASDGTRKSRLSPAPFRISGAYARVTAAYFMEGFGYIIGATFLVALVRETTKSGLLADAAWILTGLAAAVTAPLWPLAAARAGRLPMLILAFVLQCAGVALPVFSSSAAAALGGGLLLGGTFMGITVLSLQRGVELSGRPSAHTIAVMTVVYGAGQIIGPFVAGFTARGGGGFALSFGISSLCLFAAACVLGTEYLAGKRKS